MEDTPSPLERLHKLEGQLDQLTWRLAETTSHPGQGDRSPAPRAIWPADELLLTRLLRRSPDAITAYRAPAELTSGSDGSLRLTTAPTSSPFHFCELGNGDAAVWLAPNPPEWIWNTESFLQLFICREGTSARANLVLQRLPVFKPVVRGKDWSLFLPGELVPRSRRSQTDEEKHDFLRRLEQLERHFRQEKVRRDSEIAELRARLEVQQGLVDRLLQLHVKAP